MYHLRARDLGWVPAVVSVVCRINIAACQRPSGSHICLGLMGLCRSPEASGCNSESRCLCVGAVTAASRGQGVLAQLQGRSPREVASEGGCPAPPPAPVPSSLPAVWQVTWKLEAHSRLLPAPRPPAPRGAEPLRHSPAAVGLRAAEAPLPGLAPCPPQRAAHSASAVAQILCPSVHQIPHALCSWTPRSWQNQVFLREWSQGRSGTRRRK